MMPFAGPVNFSSRSVDRDQRDPYSERASQICFSAYKCISRRKKKKEEKKVVVVLVAVGDRMSRPDGE